MKLSKGALVAVVDGEKLALFRNEGGVEIRLKAIENPPHRGPRLRLGRAALQRSQSGQ